MNIFNNKEFQSLNLTNEEIRDFFDNIPVIIKEKSQPTSEDRIAALEKAIADLAILFMGGNLK